MANQNLSQFTEKTFVADADWTFVWDTAGAISKKVSRNNWLNSGTLTTSAPVTISQTWNDAAVAFTAFKVNATSTNSAAGSLLLDLQVGGTSKSYVDKNGAIYGTGVASGLTFKTWVNASQVYQVDLVGVGLIFQGYPGQFILPASSFMGWNSNDVGSGSVDTRLYRDGAANTLALRNGAAAQTFNVYGTYTSGSAYARLAIACDTSGNATLTTQSTGTAGTVSINGVPVGLGKGNVVNNVAIGSSALSSLVGSSFNTAVGFSALANVTTGEGNTAIGYQAFLNGNGGNNVVIGRAAVNSLASATNSVFIGTSCTGVSGVQNQIVIGASAGGLGLNSVVLGNDSITTTALKGNVGIGTTAPSQKLEVWGNSAGTISKVTSVSPGTGSILWLDGPIGQLVTSTGNLFITNQSANSIVFETNLTEKMRITSAGNVGIGTTAPSSKLQVTGGDVEIETVTSGIIMKAAGTSTRYRITLNATGDALVFTAV
jgi:hypothetical protein